MIYFKYNSENFIFLVGRFQLTYPRHLSLAIILLHKLKISYARRRCPQKTWNFYFKCITVRSLPNLSVRKGFTFFTAIFISKTLHVRELCFGTDVSFYLCKRTYKFHTLIKILLKFISNVKYSLYTWDILYVCQFTVWCMCVSTTCDIWPKKYPVSLIFKIMLVRYQE